MRAGQVRLVQQSFAAAAAREERLAASFFAELFARAPALRRLFPGPLPPHAARLLGGLRQIVGGLDRFDTILPAIEWLALRAMRQGVGPAEAEAFGEALGAALEAALGQDLHPEAREAWAAARCRVLRVFGACCEAAPLAA